MKKINSSGFVLAETLVVTVFLMTIFAMLYSNFLPLIGEYEKRENYDSVDGKYAVYWIKRMIEDPSYEIPDAKKGYIRENGYLRFQCSDINSDEEKHSFCINLVKNLQVSNCDKSGDNCDIFITRYRIDNPSDTSRTWFKQAIKTTALRYQENCVGNDCRKNYIENCLVNTTGTDNDRANCATKADKKIFQSGFQDYVFSLPDFAAESLNYADYRVIASFHNKKDNNNYYFYATIEVNR